MHNINLVLTESKQKKIQIITVWFHKIAIFVYRTLLESTKFFPIATCP